MTTDRVFTVQDANAELPELRERLPRLREARLGLIASSERITDAVASDGGGVAGSDWFRHQETLKAEVESTARYSTQPRRAWSSRLSRSSARARLNSAGA